MQTPYATQQLSCNMSDDIMTAKAILRKKLYSTINSIHRSEIIRQSEIVTKKILQISEFKNAKVVSIYLSMHNEVQTENLLQEIFKLGKECYIPRFQTGSPEMEMIRLKSMEHYEALPRNKWNIKQPPDDEIIQSIFDKGQLDLVLTPGLGFTKEGLRIGRGKGYYDRFFAKCKKELNHFPYTIGLAFNEQILPEIPTDQFDFPLNLIITSQ